MFLINIPDWVCVFLIFVLLAIMVSAIKLIQEKEYVGLLELLSRTTFVGAVVIYLARVLK